MKEKGQALPPLLRNCTLKQPLSHTHTLTGSGVKKNTPISEAREPPGHSGTAGLPRTASLLLLLLSGTKLFTLVYNN